MKQENKFIWIGVIIIVILGVAFYIILMIASNHDIKENDKRAEEVCEKLGMEVLSLDGRKEVICYDKITKETRRIPI